VVRHTSKAPRPPEAERTGGIAGEEDGTLDGCCGFFPPPPGLLRTYRFESIFIQVTYFRKEGASLYYRFVLPLKYFATIWIAIIII
jgi:hypothetical protein